MRSCPTEPPCSRAVGPAPGPTEPRERCTGSVNPHFSRKLNRRTPRFCVLCVPETAKYFSRGVWMGPTSRGALFKYAPHPQAHPASHVYSWLRNSTRGRQGPSARPRGSRPGWGASDGAAGRALLHGAAARRPRAPRRSGCRDRKGPTKQNPPKIQSFETKPRPKPAQKIIAFLHFYIVDN